MKTIIFIPTYWYSSLEIFKEIVEELDDTVRTIFVETGDPYFQQSRKQLDNYESEFDMFDKSYFLEFPLLKSLKISFLWKIYLYKNILNNILKTEKPDLIFTMGDRNNFYFIIKRLCPKTPIIIMQNSLLHVEKY